MTDAEKRLEAILNAITVMRSWVKSGKDWDSLVHYEVESTFSSVEQMAAGSFLLNNVLIGLFTTASDLNADQVLDYAEQLARRLEAEQ